MLNMKIWDEYGDLIPLDELQIPKKKGKIAAVIVNRDRPDLTDNLVEQLKEQKSVEIDIYVVEMGSENKSKNQTIYYNDTDFKGKAYGHNVGLRQAMQTKDYEKYWILMNDVVLEGHNCAKNISEFLDKNDSVAIASPCEPEGKYSGCRVGDSEYNIVSTCDYLCMMIKSQCIKECGFLNPQFKYSWGAIHEYSFKISKANKCIAYYSGARFKHLGGTTYGKTKKTISRKKYISNAKKFAARYFVEHYGKNWDSVFYKNLKYPVHSNNFKKHRVLWESELDKKEVAKYNQKRPKGIIEQIEYLKPWFYPVKIKDILVTPGVQYQGRNSISPSHLSERTKYRKSILVEEVVKNYNFSGKSILDLASNCSYWSSFYAKEGATSLTAVEGRYDYVEQGKLYWYENNFLPKENVNFIHSNIMDNKLWRNLKSSKYDFTLCCGIIYHIKNFEKLLKNVASVTKDVIIVDTRVSKVEISQEEPGGWFFDAIVETSHKKVPTKDSIMSILKENGFKSKLLKTDDKIPDLMKGSENYQNESRVCIFAERI